MSMDEMLLELDNLISGAKKDKDDLKKVQANIGECGTLLGSQT